jgi:hypothetical protein
MNVVGIIYLGGVGILRYPKVGDEGGDEKE